MMGETIYIQEDLRLRPFAPPFDFAFSWYQDPNLVYLVDGERKAYDWDQLSKMYTYLDREANLYFIELDPGSGFIPIGDLAVSQDKMALVIGELVYRGQGIGTKVLSKAIDLGRLAGWPYLQAEVYDYNQTSKALFINLGFRPIEATKRDHIYRRNLLDR